MHGISHMAVMITVKFSTSVSDGFSYEIFRYMPSFIIVLLCCHTTWMKTVQQDLKSNNLSLNEAIDVAHNRPLCRSLMSIFGAMHS